MQSATYLIRQCEKSFKFASTDPLAVFFHSIIKGLRPTRHSSRLPRRHHLLNARLEQLDGHVASAILGYPQAVWPLVLTSECALLARHGHTEPSDDETELN